MDGRVQFPVTNWMKEQFHLDYVDMITEPGPDKVLTLGNGQIVESIKTRAQISANAHSSKIVVIVGHDDCAGNPVSKEQHLLHIKTAMQNVRSWGLPFTQIIGIWVNKDWNVEVIDSFS
jgi:hypothetical protein